MQLGDNEFFVYKTREFPLSRDPRKNWLERFVYPWRFALTGNGMSEVNEKNSVWYGRIAGIGAESIVKNVINFHNLKKGSEVVLLNNKNYRGDWMSEDTHAYDWLHQEKGISKIDLERFAINFRLRNIKVNTREMNISARYFAK